MSTESLKNFAKWAFWAEPAGAGHEGQVVTARHWNDYEQALGLSGEVLRDRFVLNFGCGGSNIGKDLLEQQHIKCRRLIDYDYMYDPSDSKFDFLFKLIFKLRKRKDKKIVDFRRWFLGISNREFMQGDGRSMDFADDEIDYILALRSTYQLPATAKEQVYSELMRVGKVLHFAPIFKDDFLILQELAIKKGFEIVACQPMADTEKPSFIFHSPEEYEAYMQKEESERIKEPPKDNSIMYTYLGMHRHRGGVSGYTIVLRKIPASFQTRVQT